MARIGVFVCHCGENIAGRVDVARVAEAARRLPGVVHAEDYPYMCSAPGQRRLQEAIAAQRLDGVVVAACSPHMHEPTFRIAASQAGLNPFLCEIANVREQCSWVHTDPEQATAKACDIVASMVEKARRDRPLESIEVPVTRRALVVGGGIAGIRAALDIANAGHEVTLVERQPSIGGNMSRLSETFPTLDCSQCILTPLMVEASRHPRIELLTYSEIEQVSGYVGNFTVRIRRKPRYVVEELCTGCDLCAQACPAELPNDFDVGMSWRKAIYIPFPQAVPAVYTLDPDTCVNSALESRDHKYRVLACERCSDVCGPKAIDYDMRPQIVEREVGAIVVATGYELMRWEETNQYGYGVCADVVTGLEFERLLSASGPTQGEVRRPSDGRVPKRVVFIQCVGSRDPRHGVPYCSRICCMYTAKHALLYRHKVNDGQATVFYIDIRAAGKGYEEFVSRVMEEERVLYVRGRVSRVIPDGDVLRVLGADTLSGQQVEVEADLVVLATAMVPGGGELAHTLRVAVDASGFLQEAHPKLRPSETLTAGVFLAGTAQAPKDIPDTVSQASAAAAKVLEILSRPQLEREPTVARVAESTCSGCLDCVRVCPYSAISAQEVRDRKGEVLRVVAQVNPAMCEGCGLCTTVCRVRSIDLLGGDDEQVFAQIAALGARVAPLLEAVP